MTTKDAPLTLMGRAEEIKAKEGITIELAMDRAHREKYGQRPKATAQASGGWVPPAPSAKETADALHALGICGMERGQNVGVAMRDAPDPRAYLLRVTGGAATLNDRGEIVLTPPLAPTARRAALRDGPGPSPLEDLHARSFEQFRQAGRAMRLGR